MKTYMPSATTVEKKWYVVDATDMTLGRLASNVANVLRGKNKPIYTPNIDTGDYVKLQGVDFGTDGAKSVSATVRTNGKDGVIRVTTKYPNGTVAGYIPVKSDGAFETVCTAEFAEKLTGVQDVFFTFYGEGYEIVDWSFSK